MKNSTMKKRITSIAAAAVMTITGISGAAFGTAEIAAPFGTEISAYAASSSVVFTASKGYAEGVYAKWSPVTDASGCNVYCDGVQIDSMLIRQYSGYFRADAVGFAAGSHMLMVVPVISGSEDSSKAASVMLTATAHDRTGFAWVDGIASGAYNEDGTLKSDAVVLYVTEDTKDTVTLDVVTSSKGATTTSTDLQNILDSYKKGYDTRPLDIRIIGTVTDPSYLTSGDLVVSGISDSKRFSCGITIEGIGSDATLNGFGIRLKNLSNCEIRNIGVMLVDSDEGDNISLQQFCDHIWVHNCDSFYGMSGSDSDQVKGDGALDCKKSTYITFSYNHFWDNGKCNLLGLSEGTTDGLYITYHHNWYDHSDSRHPRVRYYSAHIYNNYYDGNSKYGMGSTLGSSLFAESNYFRNCKYPMLTSMQGSDIATGTGTFSSEDGGTIKAYGNYMEGQTAFVPYSEDNVEFDAYVVENKTDTVPSTITSKQGGNTYNNFDTSSVMYSYTADDAADVPEKVMAYAGRLDGGDFDFTFTSDDDTSYAVNDELMAALQAYTPSVIAIGSGFTSDSGTAAATTTTAAAVTTTVTTTAAAVTTTQIPVTGADVIYCSPSGGGDGKTISMPTDVLTAISSVQAGGTIYILEGTYSFSSTIVIDQDNNGESGALKTISAYPGAEVVFDFSEMATSASNRGIVLDGSYWHFYGFEITKAGDNGMFLSGSNNTIEMMVFNDNQDTGLQISRYCTDCAIIDSWPSNNYILNCTSKNNCDDETMENADGFAAKLTCGEGNVFDGCMSYNNSDDGWDLYAKEEIGPIGVVTIQNCVAFRNGYTEFGEGYGDCDGNGFKLGGAGVGTAHIVKNCLAFENLNCGFTDNNNPELGSLTDCTAYNNGVGGNGKPNFSVYRCTSGCDFTNLMSYYNLDLVSDTGASGISIANDKFYGTVTNSIYYNSKYYYTISSISTTGSSVKLGDIVTPTESDFITLSVPAMGTDFHTVWRNSDGSINTGGFAKTTGTYESLGYHFDSTSVVSPETTTTATTASAQAATTTTTASAQTEVSGGYVHDFTENGLSSSFYTISGNLSTSKGTVEYAGNVFTQCLKMESSTSITFTAANSGQLTLVFLELVATVYVDGVKYTSSGDGIITVDLEAGDHTITKADTANLYYMIYSEDSTSATTTAATTTTVMTITTETTTTPDDDIIYVDADLDGVISIADAVNILSYVSNNEKYPLSDEALNVSDVNQRGDGVSNMDALAVQKLISQVLTSLTESYSTDY